MEKQEYDKKVLSLHGLHSLHGLRFGVTPIIDIVNTIQSKRPFWCDGFIDLKKAIETVDYTILLNKLNHYDFCLINNNWFTSGRDKTSLFT